jgi:hypothetical protein
MTVEECLIAYRQLAEKAFTPKRGLQFPASPKGAFSATKLEDAIKETVRKFCTDGECIARRRYGQSTTKKCPHSDLAFRDQSCTKT